MSFIIVWIVLTCLFCILVSFFSKAVERRKSELKVATLETKLQAAHGRANRLHEQLIKTQNDLLVLNRNLEKERGEKQALAVEYRHRWRKQSFVFGTVFMAVGLMVGSILGGVHSQEMVFRWKEKALLAETQMKIFSGQIHSLEKTVDELREKLQREMEARVIAETKLEIILDHFTGGFGKKKYISVEISKSKKNPEEPKNSNLVSVPVSAF